MPLDPSKKEIRLIELHPRPANTSTQRDLTPRCDLIHVSLDDKPDYAALSYTWGDARDTEMITVGPSSVPVTQNLYSALEHLRYDKTVRVIWIDALCIHQGDNEEKSWQVQLMREIYQRASFVTIWLGPADLTSDEVMDFLRQFGTRAMRFGLDVTVRDENSTDKHFMMGDLNELYYSISGSHGQDRLFPVEGMADLFERPWWGRTWVLQEISLAEKADFACGTKRLSRRCCTAALNAFTALAFVFQEMMMLKGAIFTSTAYQRSVAMAGFDWRPNFSLAMWNIQRYSPYPLLALLRATCSAVIQPLAITVLSLEASDPRDKIYGLLGLAADRDQLKEFGIQPDYSKSCQELYISVTSAILRQGHVSVLSLNSFPKTQIGLPSWVPDWSRPLESCLQGTGIDHMTLDPEYKASGSLLPSSPLFNRVGATTSVSVSGFIYDELHEIGTTWAEFFNPLQSTISNPFVAAKKLLAELVRLSILGGEVYKTLKERICGAARTTTAEIGYNETGRWARIGNRRYDTAASLLTIQVNDGSDETRLLNSELLALIMSDEVQTAFDPYDAAKFCGEIGAKACGRKPFVTKKGHLGLGLDHIEPGDAVAVVIGCQVPFVLRKSMGERYKIIGEAYVDGIMDGEAVVGREIVGVLELI
ncbi:heterokaryon incompatibility protein-domain-containing protein [Hyaloscypha sp. PMI_1271]|nr:heterokaryon incompatibility protein-domain-containing protein [Hyaloscypha sp. PMI_1271]